VRLADLGERARGSVDVEVAGERDLVSDLGLRPVDPGVVAAEQVEKAVNLALGVVEASRARPAIGAAEDGGRAMFGSDPRQFICEQVENFVAHLADWADKNRDALLCQLNSYLGAKEGAA